MIIKLNSLGHIPSHQARNLGGIFGSDFNFSAHVGSVTKSTFYHFKNTKNWHILLYLVLLYLVGSTTAVLHYVVYHFNWFKMLQNVTRARRRKYITIVLKPPCWIPVSLHIEFIIIWLVLKALCSVAPLCLPCLQCSNQHSPWGYLDKSLWRDHF